MSTLHVHLGLAESYYLVDKTEIAANYLSCEDKTSLDRYILSRLSITKMLNQRKYYRTDAQFRYYDNLNL